MSPPSPLPSLYPLKLPPSFRERIWGAQDLAPFFGRRDDPVGEVWYSFEENRIANGPIEGRPLGEVLEQYGPRLMGASFTPKPLRRRSAGQAPKNEVPGSESPDSEAAASQPYFPILTKLLFTSRVLSVQVHPDDVYALEHEGGPGKTEMWYVVDAKPGATIAVGLKEPLCADDLRRAAASGEIEKHLNWLNVGVGDVVFIPPGTIHAVGPGLVFYEVQQNSDLTYRLYDFGRLGSDGKPRELHVDQAAKVVKPEARPGPIKPFRFPTGACRRELLTACSHFAVERLGWERAFEYSTEGAGAELLMFIEGHGSFGGEPYRSGDCYLLPAESSPPAVEPSTATEVVRSYVPNLDALREELRRHQATEEDMQRLLA